MSPLRLSVVLPTYNRAESLRRALTALMQQAADPSSYEIVVVENNCSDGTREMVKAMEDPRIRLISEPRQGLAFARNAGVEAALGSIVAFTDDDVEVARDWADTIVSSLDANPSVDGVGGRVLPAWECGPRPRWLTREHWAPLALQDHGDGRATFDRTHPIGLIGANVAFRRDVFERIGLFSPTVQRVRNGIGSTEDHELLTRLYEAGGRMLYEPRLLVLARVQAERCDPAYHRRWHEGHGRFYALMRLAEVERARMSPFGIPGHLLRSAARDAVEWVRSVFTGDWDHAFLAELRLRFFKGFVWTRLAR